MQTPTWIRLAEIAFVTALVAVLVISWREDRQDRTQLAAQLAAQLATAQQALNAADARQHDRDTQLQQSLAAIADSKRTVQTPTQILADLPDHLPLPTPLTFEPNSTAEIAASSTATFGSAAAAKGQPQPKGCIPTQSPGVVIPPEDLKPLYDFTLDCKACQSKLTTAQADLTDEKTKTATLTKERDAAVQAANGGTLWRRVTRAAKWFALGAAAGALAAKSAHR